MQDNRNALGAALAELFKSWQGRRVAEARALAAAGITDPAELGRRMDPPAAPEAARYYLSVACSGSQGWGE
jgi:hypothetical protein